MLRTILVSLGLVATSLVVTPNAASSITWEWTGGPTGAVVLSIVTTPTGTILAGPENGGLYRSDDGGATWASSEQNLAWPCCNYAVPSLAVTAASVYAGTWGGGVLRSDDDGNSWSSTATIPGDPYPVVLALAAFRFGERLYAGGNFGVARSEDGGGSWTLISDGLPSAWVKGLALRGATPYALFDDAVYRLEPGSSTWTEWGDGLAAAGHQSLRTTADALFIATHEGGVFHLDCSDSTWVAMNNGLGDDNVDVLVELDQTLYAGLMGGGAVHWDSQLQAWDPINSGLWNRDVRTMSRRGLSVYAGTYGAGVFELDTEIGAWELRDAGMVAPAVRALVAEGSHVYAGLFGGGVFRSDDQGGTWQRSINGLDEVFVNVMASGSGAVYAGTWNGVWRTTDQGQSWGPAGLPGEGIFALAFDSTTLLAGTFDGEVWSSVNGGQSWNPVGSGLPNAFVRGVVRLGTALYAALNGDGVYKLPDGGSTWSSMNAGLPNLDLETVVAAGGTLLLGTSYGGVYRWNAAAQQWDPSGLDGRTVFCIKDTGAGILAGSWGALHASTDGGHTWSEESEGLKPWLAVHAIAAGSQYLFAGLGGGGVWRATTIIGLEEPEQAEVIGAAFAVQPNPFGHGATIRFLLDAPSPVRLTVYDVSGRRVASLASETLPQGVHERHWDGTRGDGAKAAAGVYMIRLDAGGRTSRTKAIRLP